MKLTSKGKYTLCAVLDLAVNLNGSPVRLREISDRQGISLHYLEQLFRKLRNGGVVKSVRGPGGGYVLNQEAGQITVKSILDSVGESTSFLDQVSVSGTKEATATARYFGERVEGAVISLLSTDTLEDLLKTLSS